MFKKFVFLVVLFVNFIFVLQAHSVCMTEWSQVEGPHANLLEKNQILRNLVRGLRYGAGERSQRPEIIEAFYLYLISEIPTEKSSALIKSWNLETKYSALLKLFTCFLDQREAFVVETSASGGRAITRWGHYSYILNKEQYKEVTRDVFFTPAEKNALREGTLYSIVKKAIKALPEKRVNIIAKDKMTPGKEQLIFVVADLPLGAVGPRLPMPPDYRSFAFYISAGDNSKMPGAALPFSGIRPGCIDYAAIIKPGNYFHDYFCAHFLNPLLDQRVRLKRKPTYLQDPFPITTFADLQTSDEETDEKWKYSQLKNFIRSSTDTTSNGLVQIRSGFFVRMLNVDYMLVSYLIGGAWWDSQPHLRKVIQALYHHRLSLFPARIVLGSAGRDVHKITKPAAAARIEGAEELNRRLHAAGAVLSPETIEHVMSAPSAPAAPPAPPCQDDIPACASGE